jgi:hypothetical protein
MTSMARLALKGEMPDFTRTELNLGSGSNDIDPMTSPVTNTWTSNGPSQDSIKVIAIDPSNSSILYAIGQYIFYKSTDMGELWDYVSTFPCSPLDPTNDTVNDIAINPANSSFILVATPSKIYKSIDYGNSWQITLSTGGNVVKFDSNSPPTQDRIL